MPLLSFIIALSLAFGGPASAAASDCGPERVLRNLGELRAWANMKEQLASADGFPFRKLSMQETAELGEGLYRFGYPRAQLVRWPEIGKRAGIRAVLRKGLMRVGRAQGADPAEWYGTFDEIPITGTLLQQLVDFRRWETKERIANRAQQLAEIAALEVAVRACPLAELRAAAGVLDRLCVNYARHRLTAYHSLLARFDAGDLAVLNAIRARVYAAIAAAYPALAPECTRQLNERNGPPHL